VGVHREHADQAALYVLGALTGADTSAFEAHLLVCAECTAEVRAFAAVVEALASAILEATPEPTVRSALLERLRGRPGESSLTCSREVR
jgi:anti-sigma factor RsiW